MKKSVKINQSTLRNIVRESIKNILKEGKINGVWYDETWDWSNRGGNPIQHEQKINKIAATYGNGTGVMLFDNPESAVSYIYDSYKHYDTSIDSEESLLEDVINNDITEYGDYVITKRVYIVKQQ